MTRREYLSTKDKHVGSDDKLVYVTNLEYSKSHRYTFLSTDPVTTKFKNRLISNNDTYFPKWLFLRVLTI